MEKEKIQSLISQMTLEEKAGMCSGADFWHLKGVERLAAQPASVDTAIFTFGIYIPLALFVIMFILLLKNDLEKRYPEIVAELQKRKEAK